MSTNLMLIRRWFVNAIEIHLINSYGTEALKHAYASYFTSQTITCCSITRINFSAEIVEGGREREREKEREREGRSKTETEKGKNLR